MSPPAGDGPLRVWMGWGPENRWSFHVCHEFAPQGRELSQRQSGEGVRGARGGGEGGGGSQITVNGVYFILEK